MPAPLPVPSDFAPPPDGAARRRWLDADRAARPARLARLRERMAREGVDAWFGVRPEHMRWLTGFTLGPGEKPSAAHSGEFLVGAESLTVLVDSRYTIQARREAPDALVDEIGYDLPAARARLHTTAGARRVGMETDAVPHGLWTRLAQAAPDVELVPADGWVEEMRAVKTPDEVERIAAACAVADRALAALLPEIRPGVTERDLALRLEWLMRSGGAECLAFDVACLAGPEAALPHGSPGDRPVLDGAVLLFDFGAQVDGYRSDMTRTLFVGEPAARDLGVYQTVARSQQAAIDALAAAVAAGRALPDGDAVDAIARAVIDGDGRWPAYGHGLGHGIGLATHELPRLSHAAPGAKLASPTVFSIEPGIYLEGQTGVRIEDLVHLDAAAGVCHLLTRFPREVIALGG
jgi:Xaa-Pro aminopeptidase